MGDRNVDKPPAGAGFEQMTAGYEFPPVSYELSGTAISGYLTAVDGQGDGVLSGFVPPMFIAARSLAVLSGLVSSLAGSIHASQEFEFLRLVPIGTAIECHGKVVQNLRRGKLHLLVIGLSAFNRDKEQVLTGKATLLLAD